MRGRIFVIIIVAIIFLTSIYILSSDSVRFAPANNAKIVPNIERCGDAPSSFSTSIGGYAYDTDLTRDCGFIAIGVRGGSSERIVLSKHSKEGTQIWRKEIIVNPLAYLERGYSVKQTSDGGYLISGVSKQSSLSSSAVIIKTDSSGNVIWNKTYEGSQYAPFMEARSIAIIKGGGYFILTSRGVMKIDEQGNEIWRKNHEVNEGIYPTEDGGYVVTGGTNAPGIIKADSNGNVQWSRYYDNSPLLSSSKDIIQTNDGGYLISGSTWQQSEPYQSDLRFIKTDQNGEVVWDLTNLLTINIDSGLSIRQKKDGGYVVTGVTDYVPLVLPAKPFLMEIDPQGNFGRVQIFEDYLDEMGEDIEVTPNGYIIAAGPRVVKFSFP